MPIECTKESPWDKIDVNVPIIHHGAFEVGDQEDGYPGGDIVTKKCPNCGHTWTQELPQ